MAAITAQSAATTTTTKTFMAEQQQQSSNIKQAAFTKTATTNISNKEHNIKKTTRKRTQLKFKQPQQKRVSIMKRTKKKTITTAS